MSAARTLAALAAAGGALEAPPGAGLRVRAPAPLPPGLRAEVRAAVPALLRVASGRWRLDLAAWPLWRLDLFEERAALMAEGGVAPELVEQLAYLDTAEQPEPAPDPEPPEVGPGLSGDAPPRGPLDLAGADLPAEHPPAGAPTQNVHPIAKKGGPPIAKINPAEGPGAQLDGPEAPGADRLRQLPPGYPLCAAAGVDLERRPPPASPGAVARAVDGILGALPAVLAPWQRFELGAWGADRRARWAREVAQRGEGAEEAAAEVLAYYRNRPGGPIASGVALRSVANPSAGPERDEFTASKLPHLGAYFLPWQCSGVPAVHAPLACDRGSSFSHPLGAPTSLLMPTASGATRAAALKRQLVEFCKSHAAWSRARNLIFWPAKTSTRPRNRRAPTVIRF